MELCKHPKMRWQGLHNWPTRNRPHGPDNPLPQGEVGVLTGAFAITIRSISEACLVRMTSSSIRCVTFSRATSGSRPLQLGTSIFLSD
jgi:hypothetical protein